MRLFLYYHGGSANHGCEAIVRATAKLIPYNLTLCTTGAASDRRYGLEDVVRLFEDTSVPPARRSLRRFAAAVHHKLTKTDHLFLKYAHEAFFSQVQPGDVCLSIGGDNYCYPGQDILACYNRVLHEQGAKTVLWGCSVEPSLLERPEIAADLARYDLIVARETLSFEALKAVNPNTVLAADPAFFLARKDEPLPEGFLPGNTVGINLSPLIMKSEARAGITLENYRGLIAHILETTDMNIALIPHVVEPGNDDREPLQHLCDAFGHTGRIVMIGDCGAETLKGYIARCRFFVGARTHATIAAYSTGVPTLVVGYSVKAKGIARDLFGTEEHYVLPVQSIAAADTLTAHFRWLFDHEASIRTHLSGTLPEYCAGMEDAVAAVRSLELP